MVTHSLSTAAESVLDALGDRTRRDILRLLRDGPLAVGLIADQLPVSRPAVSKHLRALQGAGLVNFRAEGTRNLFELRESGFEAARAYLDGFWNIALGKFEELVELEHDDA